MGRCRCDAPECLYLNGNGQCNAPCLGPTAPAPDDEAVVERLTRVLMDNCCITEKGCRKMARAVMAVLR